MTDSPPMHNPLLVTEIVELVFSHLNAVDVASAAGVCRLWRDCASNEVCLCTTRVHMYYYVCLCMTLRMQMYSYV